jgi:hypothetical protein
MVRFGVLRSRVSPGALFPAQADVNLDGIVANVYDGADNARLAAGAAPWLNIALLKHKAGG